MRGVWLDQRIDGVPRWRLCDEEELMRVPDEVRDCVCFIEPHRSGQPLGIGSAFFVGTPGASVEAGSMQFRTTVYAVTAKHCLGDDIGFGDDIVLHVNTLDGREAVHTAPADWLPHPTADVAVLPIDLPLHFQYRAWASFSAATGDWLSQMDIGPGDDVFVTGLLVHHPGATRNMPIVRLGCIAALPVDPVNLETGEDIVALIEARSIGGISGSPVFVHMPFWRDVQKAGVLAAPASKANSGGTHRLLGVMHGFYPVGRNDPDRVSGGDENLNTGIAVVVLADRMLDLINREDQVEMRKGTRKKLTDSQRPKPTSADEGSEFERFENLTEKLVNTPKPEKDKKSE